MSRSGAMLALLVAVVGLFLMRESRQEPALGLEQAFADFMARHSPRKEAPAPLTLVTVDGEATAKHPWPWNPLDFALFYSAGNSLKAELLATPEVYSWNRLDFALEQQVKLPGYEKLLREQLLQSPKVMLGARLGFPPDPDVMPAMEPMPVFKNVAGDTRAVPEFTVIEVQSSEDYRLSSVSGFTNLPVQLRHNSVPLLFRYRGQLVPSFVLQSAMLWEKALPDDVKIVMGSHLTIGEGLRIPMDASGRMLVDFAAPHLRHSFNDLVQCVAATEAREVPLVPAEDFARRFLLLGRVDADAKRIVLAAGREGTEAELLAAGISTIMNRAFIERVDTRFDWALIGAVMVVGLWVPRFRRGTVAVGALVFLLGYGFGALWAFSSSLTWLPALLPAGLAGFVLIYRLIAPDLEPDYLNEVRREVRRKEKAGA